MKKLLGLTVILCLILGTSFAQSNTGMIKGVVTTADNKPAEGVTILLKEINRNAITDNDGVFVIKNINAGKYTLVVSLIGYEDIEKQFMVESAKTVTSNIKLALSDKQLAEVVIVANKSAFKTNRTSNSLRIQTPILEVPQNIQVITGRLINDQQIFDMLEGVTRNVSGATRVEHWDNYARINMRGSQVAAFRNGMNVSTTWGPLTEDMSMVERIEFVKGPAGFMLANGNPSGFYNIVTKKPSGRTKGEFNLSLGSFDFYRASLDLDGKLSKDGKLLYRINAMGQLKGSHREFDFNNRYTIAPVIKYNIDDKSSLTLEYTHQFSQVNAIGSNYLFSKRAYADLPLNATNAEPNFEPTNMNDRSILAIFDHKINDDWKLTAQTAYFNYQQQGMSMWPTWPDGFSTTNDSILNRGVSIWDILGQNKTAQIFVNGEFKTGKVNHRILSGIDMGDKINYHDWSQGASVNGYTYDGAWNLVPVDFNIYNPVHGDVPTQYLPTFDRTKSIQERGVQYKNKYSALYIQDELGFLENKFRLTLAGRYTSFKTSNPYSGVYSTSKFTPRTGLSYSIDKNTSAYFVYDQSISENFGSDWQNKSFNPETGNNLEVGIKKDWLNGKWNSVLSVYQISKNNVLTADKDHLNAQTGQYFMKQAGQQKVNGVELDVRGRIVDNLDVVFNYAFTEAKITKDSDPSVIGNQVPGTSKHIHNAWLNYKFDFGSLSGLGLSVGYQYQAGRSPWYVFDNSAFSLPDYFRLDGSISYQKNKLSFNLVVNNLLNKYLYSGGPYSNYLYWQAEPGTNARFTVGYKF